MCKHNRLFFIFCALAACLFVSPAFAEPEDEFLDIVSLIHEGDTLQAEGKASLALSKYKQAQTNLMVFRKSWPTWNSRMVNFRLSYLQERIEKPVGQAAENSPAQPPGTRAKQGESSGKDGGVKLLSSGEEPAKLRFKPRVGDKQVLEFLVKIGMEVKMGEMQPPATQIPPMQIPLEFTIKSIEQNGDVSYDIILQEVSVVEESGVNAQVVQAMKASVSGMKGLSGSGKVSDRGISLAVNFTPATDAPQSKQVSEQIIQSMANIFMPLPEEPVGKGGKWQVTRPVKSQGMTIKQTTTYELVSREGEQLTIKTSEQQTASNQKVQNPAMPGMQMEVVKMSGTGSGEIVSDLTKAFPLKGNLSSHSETSLSMNMGGQKQPMSMKMDMKVQVESK